MADRNQPSRGGDPLSVEAQGELCVPNIDARGRRTRRRFGITTLSIGAALAGVLVFLGVHPLWRLVVFLPLHAGAVGIFQARAKT